MRIVVTGATGMLGKALVRVLSGQCEVFPFSSTSMDVTSLDRVRDEIKRIKPSWIVHAAAFTRVDAAEEQPETAFRVNAVGSRNVAVAAYETGSSLLYFSTDYVFDGKSKRSYREWDPTGPLNIYGRSKLAGERLVRTLCPQHLIVRTSWLFGPYGSNFVGKIVDRARRQKVLKVVSDQKGSPTYTPDLADKTLDLLRKDVRGTYHVTNSGECSWFEFARKIIASADLDTEVLAVTADSLELPAIRPGYSVLENYLLKLEGEPLLRPWHEALKAFQKGSN